MAVNTYGLKIRGLKEFAGQTKSLTGMYGPYYHLCYDMDDGKLLYEYFVGQPRSWVEYNCDSVIEIGYVEDPMTMQEVADFVHRRVEEYRALVAALDEEAKEAEAEYRATHGEVDA